MTKVNAIQLFEEKKVRTAWDSEQEKWSVSIIDVIEVLTDSERPRKYWGDLKSKLKKEGSELSDFFGQLKMQSQAWLGKTTKEYKVLKGLKKENLHDNMSNTELILNMLAEASVKDISKAVNPETFEDNIDVDKQGGNVANVARKELEAKTGKNVVTELNAKSILNLKKENEK